MVLIRNACKNGLSSSNRYLALARYGAPSIRRLNNGVSLHLLLARKVSQRKVALVCYATTAAFAAVAW